MKPAHHAILSAAVSAGFYAFVRSKTAAVVCFLSGIFVDLDHHLDYWLARGRFPWKYKDLVDFCAHDHHAKLFLIFHSYEMLFSLWLLIWIFKANVIWVGFALGITVHIISDDFVNPLRPSAYFTFYRCKHQFDRRKLIFQKKAHEED